MNTEKRTNEPSTKTGGQNPQVKKLVSYAAVFIAGLLLGCIPMWLTARERSERLAVTQQELKLAQLHNTLAAAVIDARRAEYEPARQSASNFFTTLRVEIERAQDSALTLAQRDGSQSWLAQRDEIITLLARNDPVSAERLSDMYVSYRKVMSGS